MTSAPSFRLLPVEATEAMLEAPLRDEGNVELRPGVWASGKSYESRRDLRPLIWRVMVSAAPVMAEATDEMAAFKLEQVRIRLQSRIDAALEEKRETIGIGVPFANDIIAALNAALAIAAGQLGEKESRE